MTIRTAGKIEAAFCDQCETPCETDVITVAVGRELKHFCSWLCCDEYRELPEKTSHEIERQTRIECGKLHKFCCPKCKQRLNRIFTEEECRDLD